MTVRFFSGGAGCGKTYQVMFALSEYLARNPLTSAQKVLALTYMHGSRRRLQDRLSRIPAANGRFECVVIDSLAWRIVSRWRSLLFSKGVDIPQTGEFGRVCECAALLLSEEAVRKWVATSYPVMILDEAQDLDDVRLRIVQGLSIHIDIIAAADEFQCLDAQLQPNPTFNWLLNECEPEHLEVPRRTTSMPLLNAAHAIRSGHAPVTTGTFRVAGTPNAGLAGSYLANEIGWYGNGRTVAVITPAAGAFSTNTTNWAANNTTSRGNGPYAIPWEHSEAFAVTSYLQGIDIPERADSQTYRDVIVAAGAHVVSSDVSRWLDMQRRALGRTEFAKEEIEGVIRQSFSNIKHSMFARASPLQAMTVHGAKNREFDVVIVLWPAAMGGDTNQKRRLLYNAVTRAKLRCLVLVQTTAALGQPPFSDA